MKKCNTLRLDTKALMQEIRAYLESAMDDVAEKAIEAWEIEILAAGAGRTRWREEAGKAISIIKRMVTDEYMNIEFGIPDAGYTDMDYYNRIQVALWGNQGSGPLRSKPGQYVYGKTMDGDLHMSEAETEYNLPAGFNQLADGGKMLENAIKLTRKYFEDAIKQAAANIPSSVFYGNLYVEG